MVTQLARIIIPPSLVFWLNIAFIQFGYYLIWPQADRIFHFAGGLVISIALVEFLRLLKKRFLKSKKTIDFLFDILLVIATTALIAAVWEFGEFALDRLFDMHLQGNTIDTTEDLFLGIMGGMTTTLMVVFRERMVKKLI